MNENPLLICFYGDDFTGSTDSMEALTSNGVRTILFLDVPDDPDMIRMRFPDAQAFGVAGVSRTMSPEQMDKELLPILNKMRRFSTPILHYKMCSTMDSSPQVGSIGKVIEMGRELCLEQTYIPLLVGAPMLKRYTLFGNHYATVGETTFRLDRHPTMSKHPVTPMNESDLRLHLKQQTDCKVGLMDVLDLEMDGGELSKRYRQRLMEHPRALLFDCLTNEHLEKIGRLIWSERERAPLFVIGSSGVEYALTAHWNKIQEVQLTPFEPRAKPVDQLLVVSGSCSPVTQDQIQWALDHRFVGLRVPSDTLICSKNPDAERAKIYRQALALLNEGKSVIVYSALGPDDPIIGKTKQRLHEQGGDTAEMGRLIGAQMGKLLKELLLATSLTRVIIAGGDTSGFAAKELGIYALEMIMPLAPGGPLCQSYSAQERFDGLEIVLKGGQVGKSNYFGLVKGN